jgi:two-component system, OmpR family, response regulator
VLLVEDDLVSGKAMASILRRSGFEVTLVTTIAEALKRLTNPPQFVVLDLMLPDGDGAVVLRKIREQQLATRVMIITAVSDPQRLRAIRDMHPDLLLQKPIDMGRLLTGMAVKN